MPFYKYRTDQNNTVTAVSGSSFTGLAGNEAQVSSALVIPSIQPLYLYRVTGGTTVVVNLDANVNQYLTSVLSADTSQPLSTKIFTGFTATTNVTYYKYNAGSAPTVYGVTKIFTGQAATDSSGVATFHMTTNGLSGGTAIFSVIDSIEAIGQNNTSSVASIPLVSLKAITSNKTVTINVLDTVTIILGGLGLSLVGAGINVHLTVRGR